ncbi:MAG: lytic transglycosylase domain-containing protein, partial [Pseudomonadota bacterium]
MQLLPATAKRTARSIGIGYSRNRLVTDGAYNARLGTAFLGQQMDRFGGSHVLTFAAYNAGPGKAEDWLERLGDPRGAKLYQAIDWVEGIPYSETRNYVMRVMENFQIYRKRLNGSKLTIDKDLRAGRR